MQMHITIYAILLFSLASCLSYGAVKKDDAACQANKGDIYAARALQEAHQIQIIQSKRDAIWNCKYTKWQVQVYSSRKLAKAVHSR